MIDQWMESHTMPCCAFVSIEFLNDFTADAEQRDGISWQIEDSSILRGAYEHGLALNNTVDPTFNPVGKCVLMKTLLNEHH